MSNLSLEHKQLVQSLYRQSLRLSRDWINRRDLWRTKALEIRQEFDQHKNTTNRHEIITLVNNAQTLLNKYRHPDPIIPPSRPGGTKYERNVPAKDFDH